MSEGITAVLGPNGAGKTTLLESIAQPWKTTDGDFYLDNRLVPHDIHAHEYLSQLGVMPQNWTYFSGFTVKESVQYVAWLKKLPSAVLNRHVADVIDWVNLAHVANTKIRKLSGGMRQRTGLAEAFVNSPRLVLLDEPTVGLDPAQRSSFRAFLRDKAEGRAIVLSTHITEDVSTTADRVIVIDHGAITFDGTPHELIDQSPRDGEHSIEAGYLSVTQKDDSNLAI